MWKEIEERGRCTSWQNAIIDNPCLQSYGEKIYILFCVGLLPWLGDVKFEKVLKTWPLLFYSFFIPDIGIFMLSGEVSYHR